MLFSSIEFVLIFLPLTWVIWRLSLKSPDWVTVTVLLTASLTYYGLRNPKDLLILLPGVAVTYVYGRWLAERGGKWLLAAVIMALVGCLAWFKYRNFIIDIAADCGFSVNRPQSELVIPLGISFFIFQMIAAVIDAYKKTIRFNDPLTFLLFVSFFPQLIAGPIIHYQDTQHQMNQKSMKRQMDVGRGLFLFTIGLAMKVLMADVMAPYVDSVFDLPKRATFISAWFAATGYALQIYFDFAGYGVMAVGLGLLFGIRLPFNFNSPYRAISIIEFWRRWNITLSRFLRDYLYIPLGGSHVPKWHQSANLVFTMLVAGVWHGAGWNFLIWGLIHGLLLMGAHFAINKGLKIHPTAGWILTLFCVTVAWVFFRANSLDDAKRLLGVMFGLREGSLGTKATGVPDGYTLFIMGLGWGIVLFGVNAQKMLILFRPNWLWILGTGTLLSAAVLRMIYTGNVYEFIYFRF